MGENSGEVSGEKQLRNILEEGSETIFLNNIWGGIVSLVKELGVNLHGIYCYFVFSAPVQFIRSSSRYEITENKRLVVAEERGIVFDKCFASDLVQSPHSTILDKIKKITVCV